jgi:hypothetical protein
VTFPQQRNTEQKHYYRYGSEIEKREFSSELDSCVLGSEEKGRSGVIVVRVVVLED